MMAQARVVGWRARLSLFSSTTTLAPNVAYSSSRRTHWCSSAGDRSRAGRALGLRAMNTGSRVGVAGWPVRLWAAAMARSASARSVRKRLGCQPSGWRSCPRPSSAPHSAMSGCCRSRRRAVHRHRRCGCGGQPEPGRRSPARRVGRVAWCPTPFSSGSGPVAQLGANAHGEVLVPSRVPDCYLGLLLDPPGDQHPGRVLVVAPASLLHPCIPQPHGTLLHELVTGHPDRQPQELVFVADLTVELRAWPTDTWAKLGIDPEAAAGAVV